MKRAIDCPQWADLHDLARQRTPPCVSVYLDTRAGRAGERSGPNRLRHQLGEIETALRERGWGPQAEALLRPARALCQEGAFWSDLDEGLVLFLEPGKLQRFRLPQSVSDAFWIGDRFHLLPLVPLVGENEPLLVLALSRNAVRLWEGDRWALQPVDLPDLAGGMRGALSYDQPEAPRQVRSTRHQPHQTKRKAEATFHGQGAITEHDKQDLLAYFRRVDQILHPLFVGERRVLIVASVDYEFPVFQEANTYPHLLAEHVSGNPENWSAEELLRRVLAVLDRRREERLNREREAAVREFDVAAVADAVPEILDAADGGRIETLFVAQGAFRAGAAGERVERAVLSTLAHRGRVYLVDAERIPGGQPLLAGFRYLARVNA
jgi:hypothetical protein